MWLFDRLVVVVPFASFMIRFGNLMNSEIVGKVTDVPWAIVFTKIDQNEWKPQQSVPPPPYDQVTKLNSLYISYKTNTRQ